MSKTSEIENQEHARFVRRRLEANRVAAKVARDGGVKSELQKLESERDDLVDRLGLHVARKAREAMRENPAVSITTAMHNAIHALDNNP